jgi:hypothetical protein
MANHQDHANLIWQIADLLRGPYRPPQYERVMLPMTVLLCALFSGSGNISNYAGRLERRGVLTAPTEKRCAVADHRPTVSATSAHGAIFLLFSRALMVQEHQSETSSGLANEAKTLVVVRVPRRPVSRELA